MDTDKTIAWKNIRLLETRKVLIRIDYMINVKKRLIDVVNDERKHNCISDRTSEDLIERIYAEPPIYYYSVEHVKFTKVQKLIMRVSLKRAIMAASKIIERYYSEIREDEMVKRS